MSQINSDLLTATSPPDVLTFDFVVRSLRRRLWKAFQEDDQETALRAYQASKDDFLKWLEEEEEMKLELLQKLKEEEQAAKAAGKDSKRGSFLRRRSITSKNSRGSSQKSNLKKLACKTEKHNDQRQTESDTIAGFEKINGPILQTQMNPSEPFIADDFISPYDRFDPEPKKELPDPLTNEKKKKSTKKKRPRLAGLGSLFRSKSNRDSLLDILPSDEDDNNNDCMFKEDSTMTTPLHEAARLGAGDFIRILLSQDGDPNFKNGLSRTALHMCAGGLTNEEESLAEAPTARKGGNKLKDPNSDGSQEHPVGIHAPHIAPEIIIALLNEKTGNSSQKKSTTRKAAKAVGRMISSAMRSSTKEKSPHMPSKEVKLTPKKLDPNRLNYIVTERMDAMLALMSWNHPQSGEGVSINAVDSDGRTALHYAAELGRTDVCTAILSNFGAMLTIVDETGSRTPCELAGLRGFKDLAAQLEARALLYIDPYGLDDELMATVLTNEMDGEDGNQQKSTISPFNWFETLALDSVGPERKKRIKSGRAKMLKIIQQWETSRDMKSIMASAAKVGLGAALEGESEDIPEGNKAKDDKKVLHSKDSKKAPPVDEEKPVDIKSLMASAEKVGLNAALGKESVDKEPQTDEPPTVKVAKVEEDVQKLFSQMQDAHVEKYLSFHNWNITEAMKFFRKGPIQAFTKAGIELPDQPVLNAKIDEDRMCLICYDDEVDCADWVQMKECSHGFCSECLTDYIRDCASSKMATASIKCPHHECRSAMRQEEIDALVEDIPDVASRIAEANYEQFVVAASDYKFCIHPGCNGVVKRLNLPFFTTNSIPPELVDLTGAVCTGQVSVPKNAIFTYEGVHDESYKDCRSLTQPKKAHRFCFGCGEGAHWPVTCNRLEQWNEKMREEMKEIDNEEIDGVAASDLAQKLWIKANTRPCPQCTVPIEKNDGCNHMTCTNPSCRHEFCWICRKDWKLHGTATGGFFRCNIWQEDENGPASADQKGRNEPTNTPEDPTDLSNDQGYGTAIHSAREQWRQRQEMNRFLHHYTRWEAHADSAALEQKMADSACTRLAPVVEAAADFDGSPHFNFGGKGLSFVHAAFTELLECRSVLKHSYAFSFFRYPTFYQFRRYGQLNNRRREKMMFERLQSELEMMTEQMSDVVARSHLRATQVQITFLTATAAEKRSDFSNMMFNSLNEERKEEKAEKSRKSVDSGRRSSEKRRRHRHSTPSALGAHGRILDDAWSSDNENPHEDGLRSSLEEFMARAAPLDPPLRNDNGVRMWACSACTYMNSRGSRCAMCGSFR